MENQPPTSPALPNLERRAKRQAWAPEHDFFAVTAPGLEPLAAAELAALGLGPLERLPGGVAFRGRLEALYLANLWLRTAGRVLMRLKDFRVRTWDDLPRQAAAVPWEVWLPPAAALKVMVTLREANLRHTGRVAEELLAAIQARFASLGLEPPQEAQPQAAGQEEAPDPCMVMFRGHDRRATISLDSSGQHLHRRGYRLEPGQAPLREDLAAALLMFCGYDGSQPLLDPMCGSGTLAIEAGLIARRLPPRLERSFAFQQWPCHRPPTWAHLGKKAREQSLEAPPQPIWVRDQEPQALKTAVANAGRAGLAPSLEFERANFFTSPPPPGRGLVVINPPYGKRLGSVREAREFAARLGGKLKADYAGWRCGVVLYRPEWLPLLGLSQPASLVVPHGGLTVTMLTGTVKG